MFDITSDCSTFKDEVLLLFLCSCNVFLQAHCVWTSCWKSAPVLSRLPHALTYQTASLAKHFQPLFIHPEGYRGLKPYWHQLFFCIFFLFLQASRQWARPGRQEYGPVSGPNAGRPTAGAPGIVPPFVLLQIFICPLWADTSTDSARPLPRDSVTSAITGGSQNEIILYICE